MNYDLIRNLIVEKDPDITYSLLYYEIRLKEKIRDDKLGELVI